MLSNLWFTILFFLSSFSQSLFFWQRVNSFISQILKSTTHLSNKWTWAVGGSRGATGRMCNLCLTACHLLYYQNNEICPFLPITWTFKGNTSAGNSSKEFLLPKEIKLNIFVQGENLQVDWRELSKLDVRWGKYRWWIKAGIWEPNQHAWSSVKKKNTELAEKNHHNKREEEVATHRRVDLDQMQHR